MELQEDVVIVVGGIAGVATTLALKRIGVRSLVLERSKELRATGIALSLAPNACKALDAIGVSSKLTSIYTPFERGYITNVTTGTVQKVLYAEKDRVGIITLHWSTLLEVLAQELPTDVMSFSSKLRSIESIKYKGASLAVLSLDDGTCSWYEVVY